MTSTAIRFDLGRTLITPGCRDALLEQFGDFKGALMPAALLARHQSNDWGDMTPDDRRANDRALKDGSRIFSAYQLAPDLRVWVITDAADDDGNRLSTTVLLPEEY